MRGWRFACAGWACSLVAVVMPIVGAGGAVADTGSPDVANTPVGTWSPSSITTRSGDGFGSDVATITLGRVTYGIDSAESTVGGQQVWAASFTVFTSSVPAIDEWYALPGAVCQDGSVHLHVPTFDASTALLGVDRGWSNGDTGGLDTTVGCPASAGHVIGFAVEPGLIYESGWGTPLWVGDSTHTAVWLAPPLDTMVNGVDVTALAQQIQANGGYAFLVLAVRTIDQSPSLTSVGNLGEKVFEAEKDGVSIQALLTTLAAIGGGTLIAKIAYYVWGGTPKGTSTPNNPPGGGGSDPGGNPAPGSNGNGNPGGPVSGGTGGFGSADRTRRAELGSARHHRSCRASHRKAAEPDEPGERGKGVPHAVGFCRDSRRRGLRRRRPLHERAHLPPGRW